MNESPRVLGNRYEVGDLLGRGGMAEVHLGRDARLGRSVAIKLLRTDLARDSTFQARFRREAQSAAALNHPAIVAVYDTGEEQVVESGGAVVSLPYIVMEHVEGRTLREMLGDGVPLEVDQALEMASGVLAALEYSHRIGIVHRDIKPANVMLTPQGDIKVMDFGIARALADVSSTMTQTQAVIGTAQYLSPEQARGESVDIRSDLYSTGCLLYELLTGRPPFVADSPVAVAYQHVREYAAPPSTYNPAVPPDVDRLVLHSLGKDRADRYQTAADFRSDVDAARTGRQVAAPVAVGMPVDDAPTQFFGGGTRTMAPVAGGTYGGTYGGPPPPAAPSPFDERYQNDYGGYDDPPRKNRTLGYVALAAVVVAVLAAVGLVVYNTLGGKTPPPVTTVSVPRVVGLTQEQAAAALRDKELTISPQQEASADVPVGLAIRQNPPEAATANKNDPVTVWFSTGPASAGDGTVPDVSGKSQSEATKILEGDGFTVADKVIEIEAGTVDKGDVVRTDPKADASASKDTPVTLYVSSGNVTMPNVVGQNFNTARQALLDKGFRVDEPQPDFTSTAPEDTVTGQSVPKNTSVANGTRVVLTVATTTSAPPTSSPPITSPPGTPTSSPTVTSTPTQTGPTPTP